VCLGRTLSAARAESLSHELDGLASPTLREGRLDERPRLHELSSAVKAKGLQWDLLHRMSGVRYSAFYLLVMTSRLARGAAAPSWSPRGREEEGCTNTSGAATNCVGRVFSKRVCVSPVGLRPVSNQTSSDPCRDARCCGLWESRMYLFRSQAGAVRSCNGLPASARTKARSRGRPCSRAVER
jgi:hypothetical protein